jgi:hypothetical protein
MAMAIGRRTDDGADAAPEAGVATIDGADGQGWDLRRSTLTIGHRFVIAPAPDRC